MNILSEVPGEGVELLPSLLGNIPLPLLFPLLISSSLSEEVVKGDSSSLLGSGLGSLLGSNSRASCWPDGGQFSVIISLGVGW